MWDPKASVLNGLYMNCAHKLNFNAWKSTLCQEPIKYQRKQFAGKKFEILHIILYTLQ